LRFQAHDRVTEDVLGVIPGGVVEDLAQVAPQDFHVAGEDLGGHRRHRAAFAVDVRGAPQVGLPRLDLVQDAHLRQDAQVGRTTEVDRVAAAAELRCALDHGGPEAVPAEPVGESRSGDARAGDQDVSVGFHG